MRGAASTADSKAVRVQVEVNTNRDGSDGDNDLEMKNIGGDKSRGRHGGDF